MKLKKTIGINAFLERKFRTFDFEGKWKDSFGEPEQNFKMLVYGASGNGKTDFCIKLAKYMAQFTKVYYNSFEEGVSKTLQDAISRNEMMEVNGKVHFGNRDTFKEMMERLGRRASAGCVIIDSRDYINLTAKQFKDLCERFPRKSIIVSCWMKNGKPKGEYAQAIEYMCDIKLPVDDFVAYPKCRFGGNKPFIIWDKKKTGQGKLF